MPAIVHPHIFEVGGVYTPTIVDGQHIRGGPGKSMSAADIKAKFPTYDTSKLPQEGGWYISL